jgi:hypothetical protein
VPGARWEEALSLSRYSRRDLSILSTLEVIPARIAVEEAVAYVDISSTKCAALPARTIYLSAGIFGLVHTRSTCI